MHVHMVLAHPEPRSFNAHLAAIAGETLRARGWDVSISDLYSMDFDPCERAAHYDELLQPDLDSKGGPWARWSAA